MMTQHYRFPASAELNRRLPKETFYQRLNPDSALRQAFVVQLQEIVWKYKLADGTLNLAANSDYPELQVIDIELKSGASDIDVTVLRAIDSLIVFPVYFRVIRRCNEVLQIQYQLGYKPPVTEVQHKVIPIRYFASGWFSLPDGKDLVPLPVALNIYQLYRQLLQPLATLPPRRDEPLTMWMARLEDIARQERRISQQQKQLQREKQFNRRVELNRELVELRHALAALQAVDD
ncbi:Uncharacterised protein [Enterobacter cloacae]|uniref:DUF4391 domain-containing protein n=1 Tax=Enterobacter cloacae TaxID=550 RepID=UPI00079B855B|nr:DUF4391 domain-containing protein [Enterobacter cloacae]CZV38716.1 Uncharacterised protein [Enterobacter cloacae]HAS0908128.1 DUF4391 domain-containing protein [Enterobacter cloacae]HDC4832223.1 DUF4391 domain-containing protein [Enterobacter cloacae]